MKNDILEHYKLISYRRLADYLLLKHNVESEFEKFKNIILTEEFLAVLKTMIENIITSDINYPEISKVNTYRLLDYISKNSNLDKYTFELREYLSNMNEFSYEKYNYEYMIKQTSLNLESYQNMTMWSLSDIEESLLYDFIVTISLNADEDDFLTNYLPEFILNKNVILSLNKIISENEMLLKNQEFLRRIRTIIKINLKVLNGMNDNNRKEVIDEYVKHNYDNVENIELFTNDLEIFYELNMNVMNKINNKDIAAFNIEAMHKYYDYLVIEHYLIDDNAKPKDIILDNIYFYIDNVKSLSLKDKKKIIELMSLKKEFLDKDGLNKLNNYINKVNLINTKLENEVIYEFKTRSNIFTFIKAQIDKRNGNDTLYKNVLGSKKQDLYNMEILIKDEEHYNRNIMYANMLSSQYSIKKFMSEYPSMFLDEVILSRALTILKKYEGIDAKRLIKKLEKNKKA
ncbi:MAG: hypothetical protein J6G98_05630 [Bacilli bacterium]|nr:hypothetical protein [Bacilli bacterium]